MRAQAAEFSGYAGKTLCFFERRILRQFVSIHLFLKQALKQTRSVFLSAFLARNELVASAFA